MVEGFGFRVLRYGEERERERGTHTHTHGMQVVLYHIIYHVTLHCFRIWYGFHHDT